MIEREAFGQHVRDALAHLYDQRHLEVHPLAALLAPPGQGASAASLRRALLGAIEQLKPAAASDRAPRSTLAWRQYRHLRLRYVEGLDLEQVADDLLISTRQARRDHLEALGALTAVLWETHRTLGHRQRRGDHSADEGEIVAESKLSALDAELIRMGSAPPQGLTDVAEAARGARATVAALAETAGVRVSLQLRPDLPPVAVNRTVLRQALVVLLTYVIQSQAGPRVHLAAEDGGQWVVVNLVVEGGRFESAPLPGGSEAPLVVGRRLVELQGGTFDLLPASGDGFVVRLRLPPAEATTVLVVEDNPDAVRLVQRYLQDTAYRVLEATNGDQALRLAQKARPHVITLDVMMPFQDGWEILHALKTHHETREIPVVVCSVLDERALALSLGADDFLPKPVTPSALLAVLQRWAPAAEARRE